VFPRDSSATECEHVWVCLPTHAKDNPQRQKLPRGNLHHLKSSSLSKLTPQKNTRTPSNRFHSTKLILRTIQPNCQRATPNHLSGSASRGC